MKTKLISLIVMLSFSGYAFSTTIIVDKNGGGSFTSIQAAITNSSTNDTIKVWPGTYVEQITLNKSITVIGSGYENTTITGAFNPTITLSAGTIKWFLISSLAGNGINIGGGTVSNCVIKGCTSNGIYANVIGPTSTVINCVIVNNGAYGVRSTGNNVQINVINCIGRNNSSTDFYKDYNTGFGFNLSYSNGSTYMTSGGIGCINTDPMFTSPSNGDYHISQGSPCWNTGQPSLQDPDGTPSDMGYFAGPDCPIYPVVYEIIISPNGNNINLQAKGRANY
jgi:hypothetical protein